MPGQHILIAEDEQHSRLSLSILLKQEGYKVSTAESGIEALRIIAEHQNSEPVELLITDILMPNMRGNELIENLKAGGSKLPIIAITGFGNKEMVAELRRQGVSDYIEKPVTADEMINKIRLILTKASGTERH